MVTMMANLKIKLSTIVCPVYLNIVKKAVRFEFDELILKGGRSSFKSTVGIVLGILLCIIYKRSVVIAIKYNNAVKKRLLPAVLKVLKFMGIRYAYNNSKKDVKDKATFLINKTDAELILQGHDGVKIQLVGCDDPEDIKSMSQETEESYVALIVEEMNGFKSKDEINSLKATFLRGGGKQLFIGMFNPKRVSGNWCNEEYDKPCGKSLGYDSNEYLHEFTEETDLIVNGEQVKYVVSKKVMIMHTTIYDIIAAGWMDKLGDKALKEAESLKKKNESSYRWMWLGSSDPAPGIRIFNNIVEWDGNKETCLYDMGLDEVFRGMDFGQGQHYSAYIEAFYDEKNMDIYVTAETGDIGLSYRNFCEEVLKINVNNYEMFCDYATVSAREQCENYGLDLINCFKPEREMRYRFFSDDIRCIYVNPELTPRFYETIKKAEYVLNAQGDITNKPSKENDDFIDAFMYAFSDVLRNNR